MDRYPRVSAELSRRAFLAGTLAAGAVLASCSRPPSQSTQAALDLKAAINRTEAGRPRSGRTVTATLTPQQATIDLGGDTTHTLAYGDAIPGPPIRANVGDEVAVTVNNRLDHPTTPPNDMDGAEPATSNIDSGQSFTYRFSAPHPGTYWAHPHTGLHADYGLCLPEVIDDPRERGDHDTEWIVVLDDPPPDWSCQTCRRYRP
jgi:multicopper oxidase